MRWICILYPRIFKFTDFPWQWVNNLYALTFQWPENVFWFSRTFPAFPDLKEPWKQAPCRPGPLPVQDVGVVVSATGLAAVHHHPYQSIPAARYLGRFQVIVDDFTWKIKSRDLKKTFQFTTSAALRLWHNRRTQKKKNRWAGFLSWLWHVIMSILSQDVNMEGSCYANVWG